MSVIVKPLLWEHHSATSDSPESWLGVHAYEILYHSPYRYWICRIEKVDDLYRLQLNLALLSDDPRVSRPCSYASLEAAQAAAQEEWQRFTLCALAHHPAPVVTVRCVTLDDGYGDAEQEADIEMLLTADGRGKDAKRVALERLVNAACQRGMAYAVA